MKNYQGTMFYEWIKWQEETDPEFIPATPHYIIMIRMYWWGDQWNKGQLAAICKRKAAPLVLNKISDHIKDGKFYVERNERMNDLLFEMFSRVPEDG